MIADRIPELKRLTPEEKLILVGELWDELADDPNAFPVRDDHVKVLQERLDHYRKHPDDVSAWEDVKKTDFGLSSWSVTWAATIHQNLKATRT